MGPRGKLAKVNHGYARNFLVPNRLAVVVPRPRRGQQQAAAASDAGEQQAVQQSSPAQLSLDWQQQQFDKLMKTLTTSTLVSSSTVST